ncbi:exodeoxyribonuclease VII large subunit [Desertivirga brevis]|uniref:exodeoxyribonuclease VII large subunit n=1 Tax=Desertivirga brevis TaxID=2810310 RepID=UPI001A95FA4D|nr:exodeoxyribonuclease VII large subunit [Pedobacter sp. SYSU D00873]
MPASYISLKQLLTQVQNTIRERFPSSYWVKGEVAGVRKIGSHIYFDLIELDKGAKVAQIRACAFMGEGTMAIAGFEKVTGQKFTEGIKVGARVTINYHPVYGLSLVLCEIDAELTLGGIELQRKETLKKLLADHPHVIQFQNGSFITPNKRLGLPRAIQRIALITSASSDAYSDFSHCLQSNEFGYKFRVDLYNVLVQGYGAQSSLYDAFSKIRISKVNYDVVVLTRGGGAPADFLPFDDYHLSLALATFPIPVITGIGHHMNQGICDFFARVHTKTPSIAAQFILDHNNNFEKQVNFLAGGIQNKGQDLLARNNRSLHLLQDGFLRSVKQELNRREQELDRRTERIVEGSRQLLSESGQDLKQRQYNLNNKARNILHKHEKNVQEKVLRMGYRVQQVLKEEKQKSSLLQTQLSSTLPRLLIDQKKALERLGEGIAAASPNKILKRGFALLKKKGKILSDSEELKPGETIQVIRHNTLINTEVKNIETYNGRDFEL